MTSPTAAVGGPLRDVSPRVVLWGGALAVLVVRLVLSAARSGSVVMADEAGHLFHARVLAGGMAAEMGSAPFYRGGYALLLAPVLSLGGDPVPTYNGVLVLNALLAASLVPLLYLLLTRCLVATPRAAAWAAGPWALPNTRFVPYDGSAQELPGALFSSAKQLDRRPRTGRATIIWRDPGRDQALRRITPR